MESCCHILVDAILRQVILRLPEGKKNGRSHYGEWSTDQAFLLQYRWMDVTLILNTTTRQLRFKPHSSVVKWERELACQLSHLCWQDIWLKYRGASKNMFLWQVLFPVIATQKWRFPSLPATDARCCYVVYTRVYKVLDASQGGYIPLPMGLSAFPLLEVRIKIVVGHLSVSSSTRRSADCHYTSADTGGTIASSRVEDLESFLAYFTSSSLLANMEIEKRALHGRSPFRSHSNNSQIVVSVCSLLV